jgi:hypothetical protein
MEGRARRTLLALGLATTLGLLASAPAQAGLLATQDADWTLGGKACSLIEVPAAQPIGTGPCPGVRPGAVVISEVGQCTFNFLFTGSDGRRYIGTAGHCILDGDGEEVWAPGTGPEARDGENDRIGEFAYAILEDPKDFALIRLDAGVEANPAMCHFGGPTGINNDQPSSPVVLHHFGQGVGVGQTVPGRSALALGMPHPDHVYAEGAVVPGDSGSGIISEDGRAVGVIVTVGIHLASIGTSGVDAGTMGVTRLGPQVARAQQQTGIGFTLVTADLA